MGRQWLHAKRAIVNLKKGQGESSPDDIYAEWDDEETIGAVRSAVAAAPPQLEEVSRSLGQTRVATLARVTVPLAAPGITAGAALVFLTIAKELPATLMLRPTGTDTLAVALWTNTGASQFAAAAPYAVVLVVVAAIPTLVLDRVMRRSGT